MTGAREGDRGQSETLGFALILGITLLGMTAVVALGAVAVDDTQHRAEVEQAQHTMSLFDSRSATVALSDSEAQVVRFGASDGNYQVNPDSGTITITHVNHTGSGDDEDLYSGTLGSVVYETGDTQLAYQGGGVWRKDGDSNASMVSPPEFHYRGATLTLPVVNTSGSGGATGEVSARITRADSKPFERHYPNEGQSYVVGSKEYVNPVQKGYIIIKVQSDYYEGWAEYFGERTEGNVTTYESNETAVLELRTLGQLGGFQFGTENDEIKIRGMDDDPDALNQFELDLIAGGSQNSQFANLQWGIHADQGGKQLEIAFHPENGGSLKCPGNAGHPVHVTLYYSANTTTYEAWKTTMPLQCDDLNGDGDKDAHLAIDLVDSSETVTYTTASKQNGGRLGAGDPGATHVYEPRGSLSSINTTGDTSTMKNVMQRFFSEMPGSFTFEIFSGNNAGLCYADGGSDCKPTNGVIDYDGSDRVVTYLHITENRIEVEFT